MILSDQMWVLFHRAPPLSRCCSTYRSSRHLPVRVLLGRFEYLEFFRALFRFFSLFPPLSASFSTPFRLGPAFPESSSERSQPLISPPPHALTRIPYPPLTAICRILPTRLSYVSSFSFLLRFLRYCSRFVVKSFESLHVAHLCNNRAFRR